MTKSLSVLFSALMLMGLVSCNGSGTVSYYEPQWYYNCYPVYDYWGYYMYDDCYWEYYNEDGSLAQELDMSEKLADREAHVLAKTAEVYAEKFTLSNDQAMKIAKNVKDFAALQDRSSEDVADFAEKLYGVNPNKVASAVAGAMVGNNAELNEVISQAAQNFQTSEQTMKAIVNELHGKALEENGIDL
ncbi:MAG: hypothetical protein CMJ16_02055 [Peredibacter sp.]|nr:hypothetical protein [Peredibacter sp.]|tara:strand:- start:1201 stop:1764 length:564 start_codon:yes stop_codon:yes gene_type:complete